MASLPIDFFTIFVNVLESPADMKAMRQVGRLTQWKDEGGYGFITPGGGGDPVYVHIKSFLNRQRPQPNDIVSYTLGFDEKYRTRAEDVEFLIDQGPPPFSPGWGPGILAFAVFFLLFVTDSAWTGRIPSAVLGLYLLASALTFYFYRRDKELPASHESRISEGALHFWCLIGGWPGAALAQKLVHHESRKRSFQIVYWSTIALNNIAFFWLLSPRGSAHLHSLMNGLGLQ